MMMNQPSLSSTSKTIAKDDTPPGDFLPTMEASEKQNEKPPSLGDAKMDFSKVVFPTTNLQIGHLPKFADVAFANTIISCDRCTGQFEKNPIVKQMRENDKELEYLSEEDVIWRNKNQRLSIELAETCWFTYRSQTTNELYQRRLVEDSTDQELLTGDGMQALKGKLISYFFRWRQHRDFDSNHPSCNHSPDNWICEEDARLLEILLDPKWRNVIEFAIDPSQGSEIDSPATTVWNTVISVLFNYNETRYSPKTRFPNDPDFWHFVPNFPNRSRRCGDLLKERLTSLKSQFVELVKIWKTTGSLYHDLPKPTGTSCGRSQDVVMKLTTMYMFEIWSKNQDDEFINRLFGMDFDDASTRDETHVPVGDTTVLPHPPVDNELVDIATHNENVDSSADESDSESFVFS